MKSMTGFGSGEGQAQPSGKLLVELRALNHRFLDVRVRVSRELADLGTHAELLVRERFSRGRIEIVVRGEGLRSAAPVLDRERASPRTGSSPRCGTPSRRPRASRSRSSPPSLICSSLAT